MGKRILSGSLALSKLIHVKMEVKGKTGIVKGVFIPLEQNFFSSYKDKEGKEVITMAIRVLVKDEADEHGQHGFISQSVDSKIYKDATDEQKEKYKKLPILGNLKDFSGDRDEASGAVSSETFTPESDDLPF